MNINCIITKNEAVHGIRGRNDDAERLVETIFFFGRGEKAVVYLQPGSGTFGLVILRY